MKAYVSCNIEALYFPGETAWILSVPTEAVTDAALLLSGLIYGKLDRVTFTSQSCNAMLSAADGYVLNLDGKTITATKIWLEAVLGMLLDVCLNGWTDTAHLDQDFDNISVTVAVLPPNR